MVDATQQQRRVVLVCVIKSWMVQYKTVTVGTIKTVPYDTRLYRIQSVVKRAASTATATTKVQALVQMRFINVRCKGKVVRYLL